MIFFILIIMAVITYYFIKYFLSPEREYERHAKNRCLSSKKITSQEKNIPPEYNNSENNSPSPDFVPDWIFSDGVKTLSHEVIFEYISDEISKRQVRILYAGAANFFGYCYLRKDFRTFKYKKTANIIDVSTGEAIDNLKRFILSVSSDVSFVETPEMALFDETMDINCDIVITLKKSPTYKHMNRKISAEKYNHISGKIFAHCHLTDRDIIFNLDDIIEVTDPVSGLKINGVRSYLRKHRVI